MKTIEELAAAVYNLQTRVAALEGPVAATPTFSAEQSPDTIIAGGLPARTFKAGQRISVRLVVPKASEVMVSIGHISGGKAGDTKIEITRDGKVYAQSTKSVLMSPSMRATLEAGEYEVTLDGPADNACSITATIVG